MSRNAGLHRPDRRTDRSGARGSAAALHWSSGRPSTRGPGALAVHRPAARTDDGLRPDAWTCPKAREIVIGTTELPTAARQQLATDAVDYATGHTARSCGPGWPARSQRSTPDAAARRRKRAIRTCRVWITPESDGLATLGAYLSAEEARACWNALRAAAGQHRKAASTPPARDTSGRPAHRAPRRRPGPLVQVIITPAGPELPGHGLLSAEHTGTCATAPTGSPWTGPALDRIHTGPSLARWVRTCDRHCRFPGCRRPAVMCDLDHVIPHPGGSTHHGQPRRPVQIPPPAQNPHQLESPNAARRGPALDQPPRPRLLHQPRRPVEAGV